MGAYSQLRPFDYERHRARVAPELQAEMGALWPVCEALDADLGARHDAVVDLALIRPVISGGCTSPACPQRRHCPFHPLSQDARASETAMRRFQDSLLSNCPADPAPLILGKAFRFEAVAEWYGNEQGLDDEAALDAFIYAEQPLTLLLARLCKRGGIWGWGDGGFGEGLLGWLDPRESLDLAQGLDAYDLSAAAPVPALSDPYVSEQVLPEMRQRMQALRDYARVCAGQGLGLLLERN